MTLEEKIEFLRNFLSPFVDGPNVEAVLAGLATGAESLDNLSFAVNKQLSIATSNGIYLDKGTSEIGILRPPEIGVADEAYRELAIAVNADKQIISLVQDILRIFYGEDAVRGFVVSGKPEPYILKDGMDLTLELEDGIVLDIQITESDFRNIGSATAQELADLITRNMINANINGFARVEESFDTQERFVKIYSSAVGPFGYIKVLGGELQNILEFPSIKGTEVTPNNTAWQITKTVGNTHRLRWNGNTAPALDQVEVGDRALIYGDGFDAIGISGTFEVTNVRPPVGVTQPDSGYFEIELIDDIGLLATPPDQLPPPNVPPSVYSYTVTVSGIDDLKFFKSKKNTPYNKKRNALAWEPANNLLKIYMPATTNLVARDLIGGSYLHAKYGKDNFNGTFGHADDIDQQIRILSPYSIQYKQSGLDNYGSGGIIRYGASQEAEIDYIYRENFLTTVVLSTPHTLTGTVMPEIGEVSNEIIVVEGTTGMHDDPAFPFPGPHAWDKEVNYTLTNVFAIVRDSVLSGSSVSTLLVDGILPDSEGFLYFDLGKDTEEGPVRYLAAQTATSNITSEIINISQVGTSVTLTTKTPHGGLEGGKIIISDTSLFNGELTIETVINATTLIAQSSVSQTATEMDGTLTVVIGDSVSTLIMDSSYIFKYNHVPGADVTLLSDTAPYVPEPDGRDYNFYVTGTAGARIWGREVIESVLATGIGLQIVIVYPSGRGLGNSEFGTDESNPPVSEVVYVWGGDEIG